MTLSWLEASVIVVPPEEEDTARNQDTEVQKVEGRAAVIMAKVVGMKSGVADGLPGTEESDSHENR